MTVLPAREHAAASRLLWLLGVATALAVVSIILGATVTARDAGLACPDAPLCYGQLVPYFDGAIFLQWLHRVAGVGLFLVLSGALWVCWQAPRLGRLLGFQVGAAVALVVIEALLGILAVRKILPPSAVAAHLCGSLLILTICFLAIMCTRALRFGSNAKREQYAVPATAAWGFTILAGFVLLEISLGGLVRGYAAGLACPDVPKCNGEWLPAASLPIVLQLLHRALSVGLFLGCGALAFKLGRIGLPQLPRQALRLSPLLILWEALLGALSVVLSLPKWALVFHLIGALLLYLLLLLAALDLVIKRGTERKRIKLPTNGEWRLQETIEGHPA